MHVCRICNNAGDNTVYVAREMQFGTREPFEYFQCAKCGCLQIAQAPCDLGRHYPKEYYSLTGPGALPSQSCLKRFLKRRRLKHFLGKRTVPGALLERVFGRPDVPAWFAKVGPEPHWRVLDVGCGAGLFLHTLWYAGFSNLTGVDPYIDHDLDHGQGVRVFKADVTTITGPFDVVVLSHSFEHMANPEDVLRHVHRVLAPGRTAVIRMPLVPSYAWERYRTNWVELDAPRHLFLHSQQSMRLLAERVGLEIADVLFTSGAAQFWGSEQYARDIPLMDDRSYARNPDSSLFSRDDIARFERMAEDLNRQGRGDQACFYLRKPSGENAAVGRRAYRISGAGAGGGAGINCGSPKPTHGRTPGSWPSWWAMPERR